MEKQINKTYMTCSSLPLKHFFHSPTSNALRKQLILLTSMQAYLLATVLACKFFKQWASSLSNELVLFLAWYTAHEN